ncbi:MAG: HAD-IA family hydrolase [Candidatus Omnitrophica bacterium]|nr:HAD-IA family hydrolase [Candidatus Omnitrophota bacterium]
MLKALIFDVDGVIAETEADGHRVAFNRVFKEEGLKIEWTKDKYGELLKIAGGKERLRTIFDEPDFDKEIADRDGYIKKLHERKTQIFTELIEDGRIKARPGVARLIREARGKGLKLGIASTSNEKSVNHLIAKVLGDDIHRSFDVILAGDVVKQKKPSPEIYLLAAERLKVNPAECAVIEDTLNGLKAAKSAGMKCIITRSEYSEKEDLKEADLVVNGLGEKGEETVVTIDTIFNLLHGISKHCSCRACSANLAKE